MAVAPFAIEQFAASVASSDTGRNPARGVHAAISSVSKPETTLSGVAIFTPKDS